MFSGNLSSFLKGVKPLVLYDEDRGMVMEPMQQRLASSQFDLGHTNLFCVPEVTSVFFSSCEMKDEHAFMHCMESRPSFESGHLGVHFT